MSISPRFVVRARRPYGKIYNNFVYMRKGLSFVFASSPENREVVKKNFVSSNTKIKSVVSENAYSI